jgi:hypothetical protein
MGKISPGVEHGEPSFYRGPVYRDISARHEPADCFGNLKGRFLISTTKYPDKLANDRDRYGNQFGLPQDLGGPASLPRIVLNGSSDEHIGIGRDFHLFPAHPLFAIALISSTVSLGRPRRDRQPTKSAMLPFLPAARTTMRPSGSLSA